MQETYSYTIVWKRIARNLSSLITLLFTLRSSREDDDGILLVSCWALGVFKVFDLIYGAVECKLPWWFSVVGSKAKVANHRHTTELILKSPH